MIAPGTSVSVKNRVLKTTDSKEIQYLYAILHAIQNEGGLLSAILEALGGAATHYNTVTTYDISGADTQTITADTAHSLTFSVIAATATVSMDGGTTTITYPAGYTGSIQASTTFDDDIVFTTTGSGRIIVQTLTA